MTIESQRTFRAGSFWSLFEGWGGWLFFFALLGLWAGSVGLQYRITGSNREKPWTESFILPEPKYVERMALGYNSWASDLLYLRAIQALGGVYKKSDKEDALKPVLNYFASISALDPHFLEAYVFGNLVMGDEGRSQAKALSYLDLGQRNNWRRYQPWYEAAYIWLWDIKPESWKEEVPKDAGDSWLWEMTWPDPKTDEENSRVPADRSRYLVRQAVKAPDAPDWLNRWETFAYEKTGQVQIALRRWIQTYAQGAETNQDYLCDIARRKIATAIHRWHQQILQEAARKFYEAKGRKPADLPEIAKEGFLPGAEVVDYATLMGVLDAMRQSRTPIAPRVEELILRATQKKPGVLPGVELPEGGQSQDYFVLLNHPESQYAEGMVEAESKRFEFTMQALMLYREMLQAHFKEDGKYPDTVEGLVIPRWGIAIPDPYGKPWDYDPKTGEIHSQDHPEI